MLSCLNRCELLDLLRETIRIPSVNPGLVRDQGHNEMKLAEYIVEWLTIHGVKACIEEVAPGRPNVYAEVGDGDGPVLCLCAHMDTVGVEQMTIAPFEPKVEGNRVFGRGSCDMKGGLAAVMSVAAALSKQGSFKGKLILALVCDEEYESIGADDFVTKHRADACILTEPSDLKMVIAHKGFVWGKVQTMGKSAHGSRWDIGESAISKMGGILVGLNEFDRGVLRNRTEQLVGPASMHVSLISGGTGVSTYASECDIHIERRSLPSENINDVKTELEQIIFNGCKDASIDWYFSRSSFFCSPNEKIAQAVENSFKTVMKRDIPKTGWAVWTDAAIFQQAGIPTVNIGPSGFGLHEPVEWVDFDSVVHTAEILLHTAEAFFSTNYQIIG